MYRILLIALLSGMVITSCSPQNSIPGTPTIAPTPVAGSLYVEPDTSLGAISPLIYGSNYGPWISLSLDGLEPAYNSGVTILRFPAGSWGDNNDVRTYQIDQFMSLLQKMNAQAMINVRLKNSTPEKAAEMVRYTNKEKNYGVKYWGIGNEPTLYRGQLTEGYEPERFNKEWREFALAMKAADPNIKLVGAEINQFSYSPNGETTNYGEWDERWFVEFLKANGDLVDIVSFHRYPFPTSRIENTVSIEQLRENAHEWDKIFIHARESIHQYTGRDIPIAVTEFNSAYNNAISGEATPDSHYNAIWVGDVLGHMIKNGVFMANHWLLTSKGGAGGFGLVGQFDLYPSYYTYQMYKMFGDTLVYSSSDNPDLSVYAAKREDGALTIMVINLSVEAQEYVLRFKDQTPAEAEAWLFDLEHNAKKIGSVQIGGDLHFSPQSMTLFVIK